MIFFQREMVVGRDDRLWSKSGSVTPLCLITCGYAALITHKTTGHIGLNPAVSTKLARVKLRRARDSYTKDLCSTSIFTAEAAGIMLQATLEA